MKNIEGVKEQIYYYKACWVKAFQLLFLIFISLGLSNAGVLMGFVDILMHTIINQKIHLQCLLFYIFCLEAHC